MKSSHAQEVLARADAALTRINEELGAISGRYRSFPAEPIVGTSVEGAPEIPDLVVMNGSELIITADTDAHMRKGVVLASLAELRLAVIGFYSETSESRGHVLRLLAEIEREVRGGL